MGDDLVERMAEELWQAESVRACGRRRNVPWADAGIEARKKWLPLASAAIALALEAAARVCDPKGQCSEMDAYGKAYAAAIRAMIPKEPA